MLFDSGHVDLCSYLVNIGVCGTGNATGETASVQRLSVGFWCPPRSGGGVMTLGARCLGKVPVPYQFARPSHTTAIISQRNSGAP